MAAFLPAHQPLVFRYAAHRFFCASLIAFRAFADIFRRLGLACPVVAA